MLTPTRRVGVNSIFVVVIDTNELVAIDTALWKSSLFTISRSKDDHQETIEAAVTAVHDRASIPSADINLIRLPIIVLC